MLKSLGNLVIWFLPVVAVLVIVPFVLRSCRRSNARVDGTPIESPSITVPLAEDSQQAVQVLRVVDGDTIRVLVDGEDLAVRYIGIDTPEARSGQPAACFGHQATDENRHLVEGKTVDLEKDVRDRDRFSGLLRYVWVGSVMVNEELVRRGFAQAISYPPDVKHQERFIEAQREAREGLRGLWAVC